MILKIIIILLMFASITALAYRGLPELLGRYVEAQKKRMEKVSRQLNRMFIFTEKRHLRLIFTILPLVLGTLGFFFLNNLIGVMAGFALGLILPTIWLKSKSLKRQRMFSQQLVDALMLLSSSLKAGMSLTQAFEVLTEEMPSPISDEFVLLIRENHMGVPLEDCLNHLKQRMPVEDLDLITTAISIARETGGDLTEVFSQLVLTIREMRKLEGRVRALTVQGRLQGAIMGILPIAFAIFIYFINPRNFDVMFQDKIGQMLLTWAIISEGIGVILIRKLSKVEV